MSASSSVSSGPGLVLEFFAHGEGFDLNSDGVDGLIVCESACVA